MSPDEPNAPLSWPELPDEAVVALQYALHDFVMFFESHYLGQIQRHARNREREHREPPSFITPDLLRSDYPDDLPF